MQLIRTSRGYKVIIIFILALIYSAYAPAQIITTIAGNGSRTYSGDGGPALLAGIWLPLGLAVDSAGNVYVATNSYRVRKISPAGIITTFAGNGTSANSGDGGPATSAGITGPTGLALDNRGNLYISDGNWTIRKVDASGIITTVAGTGTAGYSGDGGPATAAQIQGCLGIGTDTAGNLYLGDGVDYVVRKVSTSGIITTVAGSGTGGFSGDGGLATSAQLASPNDLCTDRAGNLYIADNLNYRIRKVDTAGIITTVAGNGSTTYSGDSILAIDEGFMRVDYVTVDDAGNLYITSRGGGVGNHIFKVNNAGIITTIAGSGPIGFSGDGGPAKAAKVNAPGKVALYKNGDLYFSDWQNNRIRRISARPYFVNGSAQAESWCGGKLNIDTLLSANDSNSGNPERWSVVRGPYHGTAVATYTAVSTGYTVLPSGLSYTPAVGFIGTDTLLVRITDSLVADTTTLYLTVRNCRVAVGTLPAINDALTIFPNPTDGTFTISFISPTQEQARAVITDIVGNKVKELSLMANKEISVRLDVPAGVYLINVTTAEGRSYKEQIVVGR